MFGKSEPNIAFYDVVKICCVCFSVTIELDRIKENARIQLKYAAYVFLLQRQVLSFLLNFLFHVDFEKTREQFITSLQLLKDISL